MRRWTYVLCGALFLGPVVSMAAPDSQPYPQCAGKPTENDQKAAKSLFTAGQVAFNEADYKSAIQYWRDAYKRDCTANLLLLNLSRAYESAGDKREAVAALKLYLEREPKAADRPQIERRIENLMSQISGPQTTVALPPPTTTPTATPSGTAQPADTTSPVPTGTTEPVPASGPKKPITPWIVVGAGGVLTVVGALVYAGGKSKISDAEDTCPDRGQCNDKDAAKLGNDGRSQANLGGVMMGIGVAGIAGGLVWQFVFNKPKPKAAGLTNVGPSVGSGYTGLSLQGQF